jgi:hypothetical protein
VFNVIISYAYCCSSIYSKFQRRREVAQWLNVSPFYPSCMIYLARSIAFWGTSFGPTVTWFHWETHSLYCKFSEHVLIFLERHYQLQVFAFFHSGPHAMLIMLPVSQHFLTDILYTSLVVTYLMPCCSHFVEHKGWPTIRNFSDTFITLLQLLNPTMDAKIPASVPDVSQNDILCAYTPRDSIMF